MPDPLSSSQAGLKTAVAASSTGQLNHSLLLHRVASGDQSAVETCLKEYGGLIWSLARKSFPSTGPTQKANQLGTGSAEDVVQEILLDLWKNAGRFNPDIATETTFIAMIARRRIIDMKRKMSRRPAMVSDSQSSTDEDGTSFMESRAGDASSAPSMPLELKEEVARIKAVIARLDPNQKEVVELSVCEQLSHRDISEKLNMPLGTVKTRIRKGLERIREELGVTKAKMSVKGGEV